MKVQSRRLEFIVTCSCCSSSEGDRRWDYRRLQEAISTQETSRRPMGWAFPSPLFISMLREKPPQEENELRGRGRGRVFFFFFISLSLHLHLSLLHLSGLWAFFYCNKVSISLVPSLLGIFSLYPPFLLYKTIYFLHLYYNVHVRDYQFYPT